MNYYQKVQAAANGAPIKGQVLKLQSYNNVRKVDLKIDERI